MFKPVRRTFGQILQQVAPRNAETLETKARWASWLAKSERSHAPEFYSLKDDALRQLFRIPSHEPVIRDAWVCGPHYLVSVKLRRTRSLLHVPFDELRITTQQAHGKRVIELARNKRWRKRQRSRVARLAAVLAPTGFAA